MPPYETEGDARMYATSKNPEIKVDKLLHFAMGIFWKASVHSWRGGETEPAIDLGKYGESVRTFLRGETSFPEHMALTVGVWPPPVAPFANVPYRGSAENVHNFLFAVPGINFALSVGNLVTRNMKQSSFSGSPLHPILVTNFSDGIARVNREIGAKAHKSQKVLKYVKESKHLAEYLKKRGDR